MNSTAGEDPISNYIVSTYILQDTNWNPGKRKQRQEKPERVTVKPCCHKQNKLGKLSYSQRDRDGSEINESRKSRQIDKLIMILFGWWRMWRAPI